MTRSRFISAFRGRSDRSTSTTAMRGTTTDVSSRLDDCVSAPAPASPPQATSQRFPPVHLMDARLDAFHDKAHNALSHTISEFVQLGGKPIDPNRWRFLRSRGSASVYYDRRRMSQSLASLLVAGTIKARLVDIMEGLYMDNTEDTRLVQHQLNRRFVDSEVLKVIQQRSFEHPYAFTGIKWSLVKTSASSIVSNRDLCFLEKLGVVNIAGGRKLGYFIMQSVDMPECPPSKSSKVIRAHVSLCYLFEEIREGVVGVYMMGTMESNGPQMLWKMARNNFADIALSIGGSVAIANAKRYAQLMRLRHQSVVPKQERSLVCEVCQCLPSFFDHHRACTGCSKMSVCKKCRIRRDAFYRESDASLRLVSATFCISCVESVRSSKMFNEAPFLQRLGSPTKFNEPTCEQDGERPLCMSPWRKLDSCASSVNTMTEDSESSSLDDNLPNSERSLRRFSLKLLQELEDAGYTETDADLRLSDLQSLGFGEMRGLSMAADELDDEESDTELSQTDCDSPNRAMKAFANMSVASSVFSVGDVDVDDYSADDEEDSGALEEEEEEEEEILSIRPLRRSTQPPEMLEAQQLNRDGSLRSRSHAQSCSDPQSPQPPQQQQQFDEASMLQRLIQASVVAEQTFRYTCEQNERANKLFPSHEERERVLHGTQDHVLYSVMMRNGGR